ncbi:WecB/TagA/CpsF family glycosyltransferase [Lichenihabitans psoromatis]|uniref:WecB/TagA/CpsF family glycosyltransferase n=1 Tax=Lichenihabitans psoromatis TaxID=2528642 RepID=UPI001FDFD7D7|nr:WecB/TagA/CpsF family glycosyltransferase [Lichenihabitans psoromatis]
MALPASTRESQAQLNTGSDAIAGIAIRQLGGLPIAVMDRAESALLLDRAGAPDRPLGRRPLYVTSANGEVMSRAASEPAIHRLFEAADLIHADGQAMVVASRYVGAPPLPERVATTDLFHDVARLAERSGTSFYLLGGTAETMALAEAAIRAAYPALVIAGARNGYIEAADEDAVAAEINRLRPGILWIGMGVPREQSFATRHLDRLTDVGAIKTSGGLFDFLSGRRTRAPQWMQTAGLEWLYRTMLEPRRLAVRYLTTNPHAVYLMLRRSGR